MNRIGFNFASSIMIPVDNIIYSTYRHGLWLKLPSLVLGFSYGHHG